MLIEVHIIQNHAPSNLNRDDSGSPKTALFGGYRRARISSQCLKRCYRTSKTFREEVDNDLGMHTCAMPEEIKTRLLAHADTLTAPEQADLQAHFRDWANRCRPKLKAILGKGDSETAPEEDQEDRTEAEEKANGREEADEVGGAEGSPTSKAEQFKTAQSIFWRERELQALFGAYRERIEWDKDVPENIRKAFSENKPSEMLKAVGELKASGAFSTRAKAIYDAESGKLSSLKGKRKTGEEERVAKELANLILERFDPKVILTEAGLRPEGIPVDMALFGRMIASKLRMHNVEASSQFAHAISTNEFAREFDLWTRVDDRRDKRLDIWFDAFGAEQRIPSGTDGMGDAEFTSACYYIYFNVDFCALVDNLTGKALKHDLDDSADREAAKARACNAVVGLLKAAIFERPTGKFNSMATPSLPTLVLVEVRDSHVPVSYADAFAKPVDPKNEEKQSDNGQIERVDLPKESAKRLIQEAKRITKAFNRTAKARLLFTRGLDLGCSLEEPEVKPATKAVPEAERGKIDQVPVTPVDQVSELVKELRAVLGCPQEKEDA